MSVKLSDVQAGSSCTVSEIKGDLEVRQHLAKLGVFLGVEVIVERSQILEEAVEPIIR